MINYDDCPVYLKNFLIFSSTIKGQSKKTISEYHFDLRTFLRYLKAKEMKITELDELSTIKIDDLDLCVVKQVDANTIYDYLGYVNQARNNDAAARARKVSSLKSFYKYLTTKACLFTENPVADLDSPKQRKSLPKYLTLEESILLLDSVENGEYYDRDYCMLTLFLNCGMRLSELVSLDISSIKDGMLLLHGKGNKERMIALNDACKRAIERYLEQRNAVAKGRNSALFVSRLGTRISTRRVQEIVDKAISNAGLSDKGYSTHKLRHTAATLMYQHGNADVRVLQKILGHESLSTTQIYTHVSDRQLEDALNNNPLSNIKPGR